MVSALAPSEVAGKISSLSPRAFDRASVGNDVVGVRDRTVHSVSIDVGNPSGIGARLIRSGGNVARKVEVLQFSREIRGGSRLSSINPFRVRGLFVSGSTGSCRVNSGKLRLFNGEPRDGRKLQPCENALDRVGDPGHLRHRPDSSSADNNTGPGSRNEMCISSPTR